MAKDTKKLGVQGGLFDNIEETAPVKTVEAPVVKQEMVITIPVVLSPAVQKKDVVVIANTDLKVFLPFVAKLKEIAVSYKKRTKDIDKKKKEIQQELDKDVVSTASSMSMDSEEKVKMRQADKTALGGRQARLKGLRDELELLNTEATSRDLLKSFLGSIQKLEKEPSADMVEFAKYVQDEKISEKIMTNLVATIETIQKKSPDAAISGLSSLMAYGKNPVAIVDLLVILESGILETKSFAGSLGECGSMANK